MQQTLIKVNQFQLELSLAQFSPSLLFSSFEQSPKLSNEVKNKFLDEIF